MKCVSKISQVGWIYAQSAVSGQTLKQSVKQLILHGVEFVGLNRLARHYARRRLLALCYHGVLSAECPPNDARLLLAVTASQFDRQMQELTPELESGLRRTSPAIYRSRNAAPG